MFDFTIKRETKDLKQVSCNDLKPNIQYYSSQIAFIYLYTDSNNVIHCFDTDCSMYFHHIRSDIPTIFILNQNYDKKKWQEIYDCYKKTILNKTLPKS